MKIGLIGSGGREHAIAKALMKNPERDVLFVYASNSNPGIEQLVKDSVIGGLSEPAAIVAYFGSVGVDYVVVGPEVPLMAGVVDALRLAGIPAVGPTRAQARIEGDKSFMRDLLERLVGWGSPAWCLVHSREEALRFISQVGQLVVKPIGLTGGKGVRVMGLHLASVEQALEEVDDWVSQDGRVLLEERLVGEEFSRMAFVSDGLVVPMPVAQDFKYAYDGDQGGMTGGMGAYTMANGSMPFLQGEELAQADHLMHQVVEALQAETAENYRGFLYGQFMVTPKGIRVIEFNARLGDPEAINVMALLDGDVARLLSDVANGQISNQDVIFKPLASLCKYLVPQGYPDHVGEPLEFSLALNPIKSHNLDVVFASVERADIGLRTLGSRTLALVGLGDEPGEISQRIEQMLARVEPPGLRHRQDVGNAEVIRRKVEHMARLRAGGEMNV